MLSVHEIHGTQRARQGPRGGARRASVPTQQHNISLEGSSMRGLAACITVDGTSRSEIGPLLEGIV